MPNSPKTTVRQYVSNQKKNLTKASNYAKVKKQFENMLLINDILKKLANETKKTRSKSNVKSTKQGGLTPAGKKALASMKKKIGRK